MDRMTVIDQKVAFLSGESPDNLSDDMMKLVAKDESLAQELDFIESFWQNEKLNDWELPSDNLDNQFYQMLDQAKQVAPASDSHVGKKPSLWRNITDLFVAKPVMQFAMMAGCVALGFTLNANKANQVDGLQQEVESLSSLVATSLLQKQSASQRLSGISYVSATDQADDAITNSLIDTLAKDTSAAVQLASINALSGRYLGDPAQERILTLISEQTFPLVQVSLVQLIYQTGSDKSVAKLHELTESNLLHPDAQSFLNKLKTTNQI